MEQSIYEQYGDDEFWKQQIDLLFEENLSCPEL